MTASARVRIYTIEGVPVRALTETDGDGGLRWDGRNEQGEAVGSGVYLYRLNSEEYTQTRKMMLLK